MFKILSQKLESNIRSLAVQLLSVIVFAPMSISATRFPEHYSMLLFGYWDTAKTLTLFLRSSKLYITLSIYSDIESQNIKWRLQGNKNVSEYTHLYYLIPNEI